MKGRGERMMSMRRENNKISSTDKKQNLQQKMDPNQSIGRNNQSLSRIDRVLREFKTELKLRNINYDNDDEGDVAMSGGNLGTER